MSILALRFLRHSLVMTALSAFAILHGLAGAGNPADLNGDGFGNIDDAHLLSAGVLKARDPATREDLNADNVHDAADMQRLTLLGITTNTTWTPGEEVILISEMMGFSGGTLTGPVGTTLEGVSVRFPLGALPGNSLIEVGYQTGTLSTATGVVTREPLVLHINGGSAIFEEPVQLTVPLTPPNGYGHEDGIQVPFYLTPEGTLELMTLESVDLVNATVTFQTFHASTFITVWTLDNNCEDFEAFSLTNFAPFFDGFQVVNNGSFFNADGECFGMTSFAAWYRRTIADPDFYPRFMNFIGDTGVRGQNIIATRAHTSISRLWSTYLPLVREQQALFYPAYQFEVIRSSIINSGQPVLIYLYGGGTNGRAAHSILAYGVSQEGCSGTVRCYDPNLPGQTTELKLVNGLWQSYNNGLVFPGIVYSGHGSLNVKEDYNNILEDAIAGFQGTSRATLLNLAPAEDSTASSRTIFFTGKVESGSLLVSRIRVFVNSVLFESDVPESGFFSVPVSLETGDNYLTIETWGIDADNRFRNLTNNFTGKRYKIKGPDDAAAILVTLTWNTDDTDVDLYVIDPTGDFSAYYKRTTTDGGELDFDIISGYGPEHWTLSYNDVVRFGEPYRVRVHYYSDHGNGPTGYSVSIKLHEERPNETTLFFSGGLGTSNNSNNGPEGVGPDWADVATVTPQMSARGEIVWMVERITEGVPPPFVQPRLRGPGPEKPHWTSLE